jgi:proline iminopeptidase
MLRSLLALCSVGLACVAPVAESPQPSDESREVALDNGSFTVNLNGLEIHYEVRGSGPVLMTVPNSWGLTLEGLRGLFRPLEEHATMVYFDPRGMGESGPAGEDTDRGVAAVREDFEALRKHLGLDSVSAIGWSNGATNLIFLASDHPDSIDAAIFLHGNATFTPEDAQGMAQAYPELMKEFGSFGEQMQDASLSEEERNERVKSFDIEVWFPYMCADPESCPPKLAQAFGDAQFSWLHLQQTNREWTTLDENHRLARIQARSLIISGAHDMLPTTKGEEMAAGIPDAEFLVFENSGHFAPLEEPERFVEAVTSFLGS